MKKYNGCLTTRTPSQKLTFVVTGAPFGAYHSRGTPTPGEALGTQNLHVQKKANISEK